MADSQDKDRVLDDGINNPIIPDSEFPERGEFPREGWESVGLFRQTLFDFS
jgi:hypothetical protein